MNLRSWSVKFVMLAELPSALARPVSGANPWSAYMISKLICEVDGSAREYWRYYTFFELGMIINFARKLNISLLQTCYLQAD